MKNTINRVNIMDGPQRHMNSVRALKILDKRKKRGFGSSFGPGFLDVV